MNDQRSTYDQLISALTLIEEQGLYDAADWIKKRMFEVTP